MFNGGIGGERVSCGGYRTTKKHKSHPREEREKEEEEERNSGETLPPGRRNGSRRFGALVRRGLKMPVCVFWF